MTPEVPTPHALSTDQLLAHLAAEVDQLETVRGADLSVPIPACPDWNLHGLLAHLGVVHRYAARMMATAPGQPVPRAGDRPPDGSEIHEWLASGLSTLTAAMTEADPQSRCQFWGGDTTVGWWIRRQAHETSVHRWDARTAAGHIDRIDGVLAADGVSEWLDLRPAQGWSPPPEVRGTAHLHATDGPGEWLVHLGDEMTYELGHHKGDVAVRGDRDRLLLVLWGRLPTSEVEVIGDAELLDRWVTSL